MAQYIDKSALVAEIKRRIKEIEEIGTYLSPKGVLTNLLCHLDTLEVKEVQEEPVNDDLERKAVGVGLRFRDELICDGVSREAAEIYAAIAQQKFMDGAKWKENQFMKNAIDTTIQHIPNDYGESAPCIYAKVDSTYKEGDKVKVLVIKEEQNGDKY